jgi:hypothetical protein
MKDLKLIAAIAAANRRRMLLTMLGGSPKK